MTSKAITPHDSNFVKRLREAGVIPPGCRRMVLIVDAHDVIRMELEVLVTGEQMEQIVSALEAHPEEQNRIDREIFWSVPGSGNGGVVKV